MFCSTIIPTVGRTTLGRAVNSVLSQSFTNEEFEVVVVNDSGRPLAVEPWQDSPRVRVINTNRRERSVARNTGAAVATGRYLHFLDDDDWLRQDAWAHLWRLSHETHAAWLYGESQLVQRDGKDLIRLHHGFHGNCFLPAMSGEWIPLQSSLIERRLFHRLGGFSPVLAGPDRQQIHPGLHADSTGCGGAFWRWRPEFVPPGRCQSWPSSGVTCPAR
jgi:glycosyltransferase involved in cell wall biosynthesis